MTARAIPMLSYEDCGAAILWLQAAFGFREVERFADEGGRITHAILERDGATIHLGWPGPEYQSPRRHAATCETARRWQDVPWVIDGVLLEVTDLDACHALAVAHGARVIRPPMEGGGGRLFTAEDCEGHRWMFHAAS